MKECIFVVDPMCSWCWGFAPIVKELRQHFSNDVKLSLVVGGLRTKGQMVWDSRAKAYLKGHWEQVAKSTKQPFSELLLEKEYFEYDTYLACKAVVSARELFGMKNAFEYLYLLQHSFYAKGVDITTISTLSNLVESIGLNAMKFKTFYKSNRAELLMQHDFAKARSMGANAFPSVVIIDEEGHMVCQKGYRSLTEMNNLLKDNDA